MTTRIIIGVIVLAVIAVLGVMFMTPSPVVAPVQEETTVVPTAEESTATASLSDLESAVNADLMADVSAAQIGSDVDETLSAQQTTVTNLTNATNDTNF
jgi:hypothetical protein